MSKEIPEFEVKEHEDFKDLFVSGAHGGLNPLDGNITYHVDHVSTRPVKGQPGVEKPDKFVRTKLIRIHMTPTVWKSIAKWMNEHVSKYEKAFGKIPETTPEASKDKSRPSSVYG